MKRVCFFVHAFFVYFLKKKREKRQAQIFLEKLQTEISGEYKSKLKMMVATIIPKIAFQLELRDTEGVIATSVEDKSKAERLGFKKRDIIKQVNNFEIADVVDFEKIEKKIKENGKVVLFVEGEGELYFLTVNY